MVSKSEKKAEEAKVPQEEVSGNKYELMLILVPDLSKDDVEKELKKFRKEISKFKGEIYHEDDWDVRNLAYLIKKQDRGYFVILYFTCPEDQTKHLKEFEKDLLLDKSVLRHLLVKSPKGYAIKKLSELEFTEEDRKKMRAKPKEGGRRVPKKPVKKEEPKEESKEEPKPEKEEVVEKAPEPTEPTPKPEEPTPEPAEEPAEEKPEEKAEEPEEKPEKAKEEPKKKAMDISDLDSQLQSILDDEDMNL
jgi:ribosomal protein S6